VAALANWWNQADRFDWTTKYLTERGLLRSAQRIMAFVAISSALVPLSNVLSRQQLTTAGAAVSIAAILFITGMTASWLTRWPSRRQSASTVMFGVICIAGWSTTESSSAVAALACAALAVTGGYIAFFHGPKLLLFNLAVAVVTAAAATARLNREVGLQAAVAAFWLIWFLNATVPLVIWGTSRAMVRYAARSDEDPLTGLLNRRGFIEAITRRLAGTTPGSGHLTVQMIDLDDFKRINDTAGHAAGDRMLIAVADLLRRHAPSDASICRAGGEEFLIALISTVATDGAAVAARLCDSISALTPSITASVGSSSAALGDPGAQATPKFVEALIEAADSAMYAAKRNGGNQVQHA
jgi:diguanylate cyclase (GGDEF)-like protein